MTINLSNCGFGITGHVPVDIVRGLAPLVEQAGFRTLWVNHTPQGNAFDVLEAAALVTDRLTLATGVTSVDRGMPAEDIAAEVVNRDLPTNRLVLGVGANQPPSPLRSVEAAISSLHDLLPGVPVVVGALGPKMRQLGVTQGDGILLNWLTPKAAIQAMQERFQDAPTAPARVSLYIRSAVEPAGHAALRAEAARYAAIPSYAANFARLGFEALQSAIGVDTPDAFQTALAEFQDAVDEPVIRAITGEESLAAYARIIEFATN